MQLSGLIFFHKISENRVTGSSKSYMRLFEKLCGPTALPNAVLCTTMWDITDTSAALEREKELCDDYWGGMIAQGSTVVRHTNTKASALTIVQKLIERQPVVIELQNELARNVPLEFAGAGVAIVERNNELKKMCGEELASLQRELNELDPASSDCGRKREEVQRDIEVQRREVARLDRELADLRASRNDRPAPQVKSRAPRSDKKCVIM